MTIDWVTVSAQIINFLILVWLLKHFLYQPVISAMDEREQRVTQRLKDAQHRELLAKQLGNDYSQQQAEFKQSRDQLLQQATEDAFKVKHELLAEARQEVAVTRANWQQQTEFEKQQFIESLQQRVTQSVLAITRKALTDLADSDLERQLVTTFLARLQALSQAETEQFKHTEGSISVTSSFELDTPSQRQITEVIQSILATRALPNFEVSSINGWGIELDIDEQRLGWNIDSYLDELSSEFDKSLADSR